MFFRARRQRGPEKSRPQHELLEKGFPPEQAVAEMAQDDLREGQRHHDPEQRDEGGPFGPRQEIFSS
jgi:hypothetical protein